MSARRHTLGAAVALACLALPSLAQAQSGCPTTVDAASFANAERFEAMTRKLGNFGLRLPASAEHNEALNWIEGQMGAIPGVQLRKQEYKLNRWQPTTKAKDLPGRDLASAARLGIVGGAAIDAAGPIAYTKPTPKDGVEGEVVYLPANTPITAENARGKIVMRDHRIASLPYAAIAAFAHYLSTDLAGNLADSYDRPFLASESTADEEAAAAAGAAGYIEAFDVPTRHVRGYYSSHNGVLQDIPGVWVGVDERERLKKLAADGGRLRMHVDAEVDRGVPTRNIVATLPGQSKEKVVVFTNSDGNSYVQENASVALIALAEHLAKLPLECRPRTIEFVFASAHLAYTDDGVDVYIDEEQRTGAVNDIAFGIGAEHFGTKEISRVPRTDGGPGSDLAYSGKAEPYAWFAPTELPALSTAMSAAVIGRQDPRTAVLRGLDVPAVGRIPLQCSLGGLAGFFHASQIPSVGGISGPWSMWSPAFGIESLDFDRMRSQALTVGDVVLSTGSIPKAVLDGAFPAIRAAVAAGAPSCFRAADGTPAEGPKNPLTAETAVANGGKRVLVRFYGRRRADRGVRLRLSAPDVTLRGISVELRRGSKLVVRSARLVVTRKTRSVVLRRSGRRKFAAGSYRLVVRQNGREIQRRTVRIGVR